MASSFCPSSNTSLTDSDLSASYGTGTSPGILPSGGFPQSARNSEGLLGDAILKSTVDNLKKQQIIPSVPTTIDQAKVMTYMKADATFSASVKSEYCFYDSRYKYVLNKLITLLASSYGSGSEQNLATVQSYLTKTQAMNQKLNDLSQLINAIASDSYELTKRMDSSIKKINKQISARAEQIKRQANIIKTDQGAANLLKEMVHYTEEKNRSTNNLLSLYTFLDVFVLVALVYLYRSSSSQ